MSFTNLKKAVLLEAKKEVGKIEQSSQQQVNLVEQKITRKARDLEEKIIQNAKTEGKRQAQKLRQDTELAGRAAVLNAKQEELTATKKDLVQKFLDADQGKTTQVLNGLLAQLPEEKGSVLAGDKHHELLKSLLPLEIKLEEKTIKDEGGFIYSANNTEINLTFSYLVEQLFKKHRATIAKLLFS